MKTKLSIVPLFFCLASFAVAQRVPVAVHVQILKAEDARRYDAALERLLKSPNAQIRSRAALAAGRIGNEKAVPAIVAMLESDASHDARAMAAFALGELESAAAADAIAGTLRSRETPPNLRARAVEAAGKIAAANAENEKAKILGAAILATLDSESAKRAGMDREVVLLALTAALRARPEGTGVAAAKFLTSADARMRADAANTIARVRAKNANAELRAVLQKDTDPIARANAARALGAAEEKEALSLLINAATEDADSRVRVSAIRSLAALSDASAAAPLLTRGEKLLAEYKRSSARVPAEKNELLEISTALGRILANSENQRAVAFLRDFVAADKGFSPEPAVARVRVSQNRGSGSFPELVHWRQHSTMAQIVGEFAAMEPVSDEGKRLKSEAPDIIRPLAKAYAEPLNEDEKKNVMSAPDVLRAFAAFKTEDLDEVLRAHLAAEDVFLRATAAELLGERPASKANVAALKTAFEKALATDHHDNDAQLAILSSLVKLDKTEAAGALRLVFSEPDYVLRRRAAELIKTNKLEGAFPDLEKAFPGYTLGGAPVWPYDPKTGTKLGQVLNKDADYRRVLARRNGTVRAVLTTEKGTFTVELFPEDAPLTVDNFIKLARSKYFDGLEVHRVVPNFVMQDGDPRGDGNGGPGWSIRCEINMVPYERGMVGMALSGKDTGGSQWFVTHSPQPHLDGGYTVFGRVNEMDMKVVDNIVRGDKILHVKIMESGSSRKTERARRKEARTGSIKEVFQNREKVMS